MFRRLKGTNNCSFEPLSKRALEGAFRKPPPPPAQREWGDEHKHILASFGVPVKAKIKYLGTVLGHVSSEEAYAPTIARAMQRAEFMRTLPLTHQERVALFQEWVLPLLIFPARAYFPTDACSDIPGVSSV